MKFFDYPSKPFKITQNWGIPNEIYKRFGFSKHNGTDFATGTPTFPLYAPYDMKIVNVAHAAKGAGFYITTISRRKYIFEDGKSAYVLADFMHLKNFQSKPGENVIVGQQFATANNTGFSTGPHTHIQTRRVQNDTSPWLVIDTNDANDSFDIMKHATGKYAKDVINDMKYSERLDRLGSYYADEQDKRYVKLFFLAGVLRKFAL